MCFTKRKQRAYRKKVNIGKNKSNKNKIYPDLKTMKPHEVGKLLNKGTLSCGSCGELFPLSGNDIKGICGGCDKFLHCGIAGKCVGPNCTYNDNHLTWCSDCVPKDLLINHVENHINGKCICKECSQAENIDPFYIRKL